MLDVIKNSIACKLLAAMMAFLNALSKFLVESQNGVRNAIVPNMVAENKIDNVRVKSFFRTGNTSKTEIQNSSTDRQRTPQPEPIKQKQQQSAACTPVKKAHHWIETLLKVPLTSSSVNKMTHSQLRRTSRNCLPVRFLHRTKFKKSQFRNIQLQDKDWLLNIWHLNTTIFAYIKRRWTISVMWTMSHESRDSSHVINRVIFVIRKALKLK